MKEHINIPELRFPEYDNGWKSIKIGNIADFKAGYAFKSNLMLSEKSRYQIIKMSNVYKNELRLDRSPSYWHEIDKKQKEFILNKGDSILTLTGTVNKRDYGYSVIINENEKYLLNQRLVRLREKENISVNEFLYLIISHEKFLDKFFNEAKGGTGNQANVGTEDIKKIKVVIPSLPEQQKIASFFTAIDQKISQLKQKKTLLEQYKKGVMQKIFSQQLRFRDENGLEFPKWEKKRLGEIFTEITESVGERNIPTYSITAGTGFVSQKEKFGKDISGLQSKKYTVLKEGNFSYNKGNSKTYYYGCVYVNATGRSIAVPNVFISFELIDNSMSKAFFAKLFESHYLDKGLRKIISSTARMDGLLNVNKQWFFRLKIPCPRHNEQYKIGDFITMLDTKINHTQTQIEKAERWKKGLLQKMFV
jgi:type I restriction enzyme, S subunit